MGPTDRSQTAIDLEGEVASREALAFQQRSWRVERTAWWAMGAIVLAGLLGVFGGGPLSARELHDEGITLRYDAVARVGAPTVLDVHVTPAGGVAHLSLATEYLARVELVGVWPTPERVASGDGWTTLFFSSNGDAPVHVRVWLVPERPGLHEARLHRADGTALGFRQLVYP